MSTKRVKIKVTKKKVNVKKIIITFAILLCFILTVVYLVHIPIKNIYINGNKIVTDKEIIYLAELENYPPFINTFFSHIKEKVLKNEYIKNVRVVHKFPSKIYITVEEYKPLAIYDNKLILSSKNKVLNDKSIDYVPYITNNIDVIYDKFVKNFSKIDDDILLKISHVEYTPNEVDKERFLFYMVDANYVYITLSKIDKINKYNSIVAELEDKKGIIYLDSGDYVTIKKQLWW